MKKSLVSKEILFHSISKGAQLSLHISFLRLFDFIDILYRLTQLFLDYFDPPWVGAVLFSHTCQVSPKDYIKATLKAEGRYYSFLGSQEIPVCRHN